MVFFRSQVNYVRIFKIFILFIQLAINAQSKSTLLDNLYERGRWGDYYEKESSSSFKLISKDIEVDSIVVFGDSSLQFSTLQTIFKPLNRSENSTIAQNRFQQLMDSYLFISSSSTLSFARYGSNNIAAVIDLKTDFKSHIGGIIGSSKDRTGNWKLSGELDLQLENLFKDGSSFSLFWRQPSSLYRSVNFNAEYPVFSKLPFGLSAAYNQEFFEDSYINESFATHLTSYGRFGSVKIGSKIGSSNNMDISIESTTRSASIIIQRDRRNTRWLPYSGNYLKVDSDVGNYKDGRGNSIEVNANFDFGTYKPYRSSLLHFKISGSINKINDREALQSKSIKFGGSNSIRGYDENQFIAQWMTLQSAELIFGDLYRSQFLVFLDNVYAKDMEIDPTSGFGIRVFDGKFYYDVSLGFPLEGLREAKLHIKFNTRL